VADTNDERLRVIQDSLARSLGKRQLVEKFNLAAPPSDSDDHESMSETGEFGQSSDMIAIEKMYAEALVAFQKGDLDVVLSHWEDDGAYLWPAVPPAIGKAEIRKVYEDFFLHWRADERFYRHESIISDGLAYSRFGTELTLTEKSTGNLSKMTLQGVHVYRRHADGWKFQAVIAINVPRQPS
jgi:ketosteroid isomerase-like protein